jgi:hypothetical protein
MYDLIMTHDLWILSHPDDEIFGIHIWKSKYKRSDFLYLTGKSTKRELELANCFRSMQSKGIKVKFGFLSITLSDGNISSRLDTSILEELLEHISCVKPNRILTLKFEQGHQDHDATYFLCLAASKVSGIDLYTVPSYRPSSFYPYSVMHDTFRNNDQLSLALLKRISLAFTAVRIAICHKSQFVTWIGLLPFIVFKYVFGALGLELANVRPFDLRQIASITPLYEKRGKSNWAKERGNILNFLTKLSN